MRTIAVYLEKELGRALDAGFMNQPAYTTHNFKIGTIICAAAAISFIYSIFTIYSLMVLCKI